MLPIDIEAFAETRRKTLERVAGLSEAEMQRRPDAETWSPALLLEHLLLTERRFRNEIAELVRLKREGLQPYLNRVLADLPGPWLGLLPRQLLPLVEIPLSFGSAFLPRRAVEIALRYRVIKAKAPKIIEPQGGRSGDELRASLRSSFEETQAVFVDNADLDFRKLVYHSVIVGVLDAGELVGVIDSHEQRHQEQLDEILGAIRQ